MGGERRPGDEDRTFEFAALAISLWIAIAAFAVVLVKRARIGFGWSAGAGPRIADYKRYREGGSMLVGLVGAPFALYFLFQVVLEVRFEFRELEDLAMVLLFAGFVFSILLAVLWQVPAYVFGGHVHEGGFFSETLFHDWSKVRAYRAKPRKNRIKLQVERRFLVLDYTENIILRFNEKNFRKAADKLKRVFAEREGDDNDG